MKKNNWVNEDWLINYPDGIIKYNDMFRHTLLGYDEIVEVLYEILEKYQIKSILDLGCGTGTFLEKLYEKGAYECVGIDRNSETINFAIEKVKNKQLPIEFVLGDCLKYEFGKQYDSVIEMFVPFSKISQAKMIENAHRHIKKDGILMFMVCEEMPDSLESDSKVIITYSENEITKCARIEPWDKEGKYLQWNPLLLIEEEGNFKYYIDHDEIELFNKQELHNYLEEIKLMGYEILERHELPVRKSSPPWSTETIIVARKIGG